MWTQTTYEDAMREIMERAATDSAFRQLCLDRPHEAVQEVSGIPVPDGVKLKFVEDPPDEQVYVLPPPLSDREDLTDEEVEQVLSTAVLWIVSGTPGSSFFVYRTPRSSTT